MPSGGVLDESRSGDNPQMTVAEIEAVVAAAHDYGFTVAAHAHGAEAIRRAVIGGVDSIEHGTFADDADAGDAALAQARIRAAVERGRDACTSTAPRTTWRWPTRCCTARRRPCSGYKWRPTPVAPATLCCRRPGP